MIRDRHKGATFIIGGTSPNGKQHIDVPTGTIVVGVNNYPLHDFCDYWLTCDTHRIPERMPRALAHLSPGVETFYNAEVRKPKELPEPTYYFTRPKGTKTDANCQPVGDYPIGEKDFTLALELQHTWTSATAAANLAYIMGASRIILHRVDLTGETLSNGKMVPWETFAPDVSAFFRKLPVPVFKTNPDSPLELPCYEFES